MASTFAGFSFRALVLCISGLALSHLFPLEAQIGFNQYVFNPNTETSFTSFTAGPDNALWFTSNYHVGRMTLVGELTSYALSPNTNSAAITKGPDGALWFFDIDLGGDTGVDNIGRVTPSGVFTYYPLPTQGLLSDLSSGALTTGPDGALWFTERNDNIGRITTSGAITAFPLPTPGNYLGSIVTGPDGALWFGDNVGVPFGGLSGNIGRITTSGVVTTYPVPSGQAVNGITVGPDGAIWFTEEGFIGRISTGGTVTEYSTSQSIYQYGGAEWITAAGPDLWFSARTDGTLDENVVVRMNTSGEIVGGSRLPLANYTVNAVGPGPGKMVWVAGQIPGYVDFGGAFAQVVIASANMTASPNAGGPLTGIVVAGSGFSAGETVSLHLDSTVSGQLQTVPVDETGSFNITVTLNQAPSGVNGIFGLGLTSGKTGVANFTVSPQLVVSPETVSPGSTVTIEGYGFDAFYTLEVVGLSLGNIGQPGTNIHGSFSKPVAYTVPAATSPGVYKIYAKYPGSLGAPAAFASLTVQ
jgi:streptogramin lyase